MTHVDLATALSLPYRGEDGIVSFTLGDDGLRALHCAYHAQINRVLLTWGHLSAAAASDATVPLDGIALTLPPASGADQGENAPETGASGNDGLRPDADIDDENAPLNLFDFDEEDGFLTVHYHGAVPDGRLILAPAKDGLYVLYADDAGTILAATRIDPLSHYRPTADPQ